FFQAVAGLRDFHRTGVQTCALPVWSPKKGPLSLSAPGCFECVSPPWQAADRAGPVRELPSPHTGPPVGTTETLRPGSLRRTETSDRQSVVQGNGVELEGRRNIAWIE